MIAEAATRATSQSAPASAPARGRAKLGFFLLVSLIVLTPPLAGMALLALQVLGDGSIDLARYDLFDVPRAAFALALVGVVLGYTHGLLPALMAGAGVLWLLATRKRITLGRLLLCLLIGGGAGALLGAPLIGVRGPLGVLVVMLAVVSALWLVLKKALPDLFPARARQAR